MSKVDWHHHLSNHQKSKLSIALYCRREGLSPSGFYCARKRLQGAQGFTPVIVKEETKTRRFELSIGVSDAGLLEFRGETNDAAFIAAVLARALP